VNLVTGRSRGPDPLCADVDPDDLLRNARKLCVEPASLPHTLVHPRLVHEPEVDHAAAARSLQHEADPVDEPRLRNAVQRRLRWRGDARDDTLPHGASIGSPATIGGHAE
jgi:hypothetical protein